MYGGPWTQERALGFLRGSPAFDQRCVAALERVLQRELPLTDTHRGGPTLA